ncbi:related to Cystathionine beta-lyase [Saccharomycodes ludwigii]|uniref:cysteine-S-conjugate beta-lyase n=1 Tax=Saccharomycodes ludwigii TaxID=36035 RepID=A0A376B1C9_9ASCO|nr:hypothetical protein SCDLUD_001396 [Saccharomycodes ludwigii]KAH3901630.1 hypothetical protein SCDLUD_001396 [Saccharomycodes ludwigii]SSD58442.1 related to Cystathionine beta-lyase [Saccharomycodes ludwigii]
MSNTNSSNNSLSVETQLISLNSNNNDQFGSSVPPLYQSTTFKQASLDEPQKYDYTRSGNPTRTLLQHQIAKLYDNINGDYVFAVNSGMACLDIILRGLVLSEVSIMVNNKHTKPIILAGDDLYGGTQRLLDFIGNTVDVVHVDTTNTKQFLNTYKKYAKRCICVLLESPTNPLCKVADLPKIISVIKSINSDCIVVVDNTMMSGLNCNPLTFGSDVVYESATKYLNGHHDIMAGVIIAKNEVIARKLYFVINSVGSGLSPLDSWLLIRGLKTLSVRLYRQQFNAMVLSRWLVESCGFNKTNYVGLKEYHAQYNLHKSFNKGPGAVLSFETGCFDKSKKIVTSKFLKIWNCTVSFGCVNSLISMPCKMSHASIDPKLRKERDFPEDLIRLCCGIENIQDLQNDLLRAFVDAGCIELINGGEKIVNLLNGHVGVNTIGKVGKIPNIYDLFENEHNGEHAMKSSILSYQPSIAKL